MQASHWPAVAKIYQDGIETDMATFEMSVPTYQKFDCKYLQTPRLVLELNQEVKGWAVLSKVSGRTVYKGVAEVSVYVSPTSKGMGVGFSLLRQLVFKSEDLGYWTLQSSIFPENMASIRLHQKLGFRYLGTRERIAKDKHGIWRDNLIFERRSERVGIE